MNWPQCPAQNAADAVSCENCGSRLEVACANCGGPNRLGTKFRNKCGERLPESGTATLTAAPKFGCVQAYSPKHLAEKILTFKSALESPDLTRPEFPHRLLFARDSWSHSDFHEKNK